MKPPHEAIDLAIDRFIKDVSREAKKSGWAPTTYLQHHFGYTFDEDKLRRGRVKLGSLRGVMTRFYEERSRVGESDAA